jgi:hypothetical protein
MTYFACTRPASDGTLSVAADQGMPRWSPFAITLSRDERAALEERTRKYTSPYRDVVRAKITLHRLASCSARRSRAAWSPRSAAPPSGGGSTPMPFRIACLQEHVASGWPAVGIDCRQHHRVRFDARFHGALEQLSRDLKGIVAHVSARVDSRWTALRRQIRQSKIIVMMSVFKTCGPA